MSSCLLHHELWSLPSTCSYYPTVPAELPEMEHHQVYGLATPEDFVLPPHHPLWTEESYAAFQFSPNASEKYDTKVSLLPLPPPSVTLHLCRPLPARRRLAQYPSQTLLRGRFPSLRPSPAAPYLSQTTPLPAIYCVRRLCIS